MVFVKIGRNGGRVIEYAFNEGITLREALAKCAITLQPNEIIIIPGYPTGINLDYKVTQANSIFIINTLPPQINVRASRIGETLRAFKVEVGCTIYKVLSIAGISIDIHRDDIWIHRDGVDQGVKKLSTDIALEGDIIVVEPKKTARQELTEMIEDLSDDQLDQSEVNDWVNRIIVVAKKV